VLAASSGAGSPADKLVGLAALVVGPGAVLMGGTIPFLTQALPRDLSEATRIHAQVYAVNTLGGFAGAFAAGFWLVPALGLAGVLTAMAALNLVAGAAFAAMGLRAQRSATPTASPGSGETARGPRFPLFAAVALLCGFAMMAAQTVLIRLGALALGASQLTFSMVVAAFVACIAVGSFGVAALPRIPAALLATSLWGVAALLALLYMPLENVTWAAHVLRSFFGREPAELTGHALAVFAVLLAVIGPAVTLSGATLPLVFHHLRREHGELGAVAEAVLGELAPRIQVTASRRGA
jgi:spermidine synthase